MNFPIDIIENPESRISYYHSLGFDSKLTLFPSSAFEQSLMLVGLYSTIPQDYDTELEHEEEGIERDSYIYNILLRFERYIRNFIVKKMEEVVGPRWIRQRVSSEMSRIWRERQETARMNSEAECRLIDYADFTDYAKIIERNDNWNDVFKPYFGRREDMRESFQRLYPIRLCTMHARFITSDDQLLLLSETPKNSQNNWCDRLKCHYTL